MIKTYHVKSGDKVVVNTGEFAKATATVVTVIKKTDRVVLEFDVDSLSDVQKNKVDNRKRTVKKSQANPEGGIIQRTVSVHVSNVNKLKS